MVTGHHRGMTLKAQIKYWLTPKELKLETEHIIQRANRGWSEVDGWGAGEHILEVTSGLLKELAKRQNPLGWKNYFKINYQDMMGYKNLSQVAEDIDNYLKFEKTSWADNLPFKLDGFDSYSKKQDAQTRQAIKKWRKEEDKKYKKAQKAMNFVSANLSNLWW